MPLAELSTRLCLDKMNRHSHQISLVFHIHELCIYPDICASVHVERDSSAAGREGQIRGPESC